MRSAPSLAQAAATWAPVAAIVAPLRECQTLRGDAWISRGAPLWPSVRNCEIRSRALGDASPTPRGRWERHANAAVPDAPPNALQLPHGIVPPPLADPSRVRLRTPASHPRPRWGLGLAAGACCCRLHVCLDWLWLLRPWLGPVAAGAPVAARTIPCKSVVLQGEGQDNAAMPQTTCSSSGPWRGPHVALPLAPLRLPAQPCSAAGCNPLMLWRRGRDGPPPTASLARGGARPLRSRPQHRRGRSRASLARRRVRGRLSARSPSHISELAAAMASSALRRALWLRLPRSSCKRGGLRRGCISCTSARGRMGSAYIAQTERASRKR